MCTYECFGLNHVDEGASEHFASLRETGPHEREERLGTHEFRVDGRRCTPMR